MNLRAPAIPLITVDPYFSLWSETDCLYDSTVIHWTGKPNTLKGIVTVDGTDYRFMGEGEEEIIPQNSCDISALVTDYSFANEAITLTATFFTPLLPDDLYRLSRPVSYLSLCYTVNDGRAHTVGVKIFASEELCIDKKGSEVVEVLPLANSGKLKGLCIGSKAQRILNRCGDDLRIEWGYFALAGDENAQAEPCTLGDMAGISLSRALTEGEDACVLFAYDDIHSLEYFKTPIDAYWKKAGKSLGEVMNEAFDEQWDMYRECVSFSMDLYEEAEEAGGEKYAELLSLAYRQVIASHKLALDPEGEVVFISKECFSNGCAATVDVTYPSTPMFLLYNTELAKGMLRPVFRYALSDQWEFDHAPHDVGTYPFVNGQAYGTGSGTRAEWLRCQMPVEECGNMLVTVANIAIMDGNTDFADQYETALQKWVRYLIAYGEDPANQLCTDDFAGHLAHNCNLSLKAIMGVAGYAVLMKMRGNTEKYEEYFAKAQAMANSWVKRAANADGSFRLAFDRPDTFSMKYNAVWDKLWGTELFPPYVINSELCTNRKHFRPYGMPLDNRKNYTKSDWLVWTATLCNTKEDFERFIAPLWQAYHVSPSRVPMTDWYDTDTSLMVGFRHRSVQGGLFIKMLEGKMFF